MDNFNKCIVTLSGVDSSGNLHTIRTTDASYDDLYDCRQLVREAKAFVFAGSFMYGSIRYEIRSPYGSFTTGPLTMLLEGKQVDMEEWNKKRTLIY